MVLDPFMGSGTTVLVAERMGRRSIGIEINKNYYAQVREKLSKQNTMLNLRPKPGKDGK